VGGKYAEEAYSEGTIFSPRILEAYQEAMIFVLAIRAHIGCVAAPERALMHRAMLRVDHHLLRNLNVVKRTGRVPRGGRR
jgi:hypothetical protein